MVKTQKNLLQHIIVIDDKHVSDGHEKKNCKKYEMNRSSNRVLPIETDMRIL